MPSTLTIALDTKPDQLERLRALQELFAKACNHLAPLVRDARCWNRVALHHLAYKGLRENFPALGSQMACNAIYSVSRAARIVYQHPDSPWNIAARPEKGLPQLHFMPEAPVFFDRHTLSMKGSQLSLFTLDGRMRISLEITPENQERFARQKLREISMFGNKGRFRLVFLFAEPGDEQDSNAQDRLELPDYLLINADRPLPETANNPSAVCAVTP